MSNSLIALALLAMISAPAFAQPQREEGMGFWCTRSNECPGVEVCCQCDTYAGVIPVCTNEAHCKVMGYCRVLPD